MGAGPGAGLGLPAADQTGALRQADFPAIHLAAVGPQYVQVEQPPHLVRLLDVRRHALDLQGGQGQHIKGLAARKPQAFLLVQGLYPQPQEALPQPPLAQPEALPDQRAVLLRPGNIERKA